LVLDDEEGTVREKMEFLSRSPGRRLAGDPHEGRGQGEGSPNRIIRAALLRESSAPFRIETLHLDAPRAREVVVRIVASGTEFSVRYRAD
jgi:hypothetical protein